MNWVREAVQGFGRQIGVEHLELGPQGSAELKFASGMRLALESCRRHAQEELLVYQMRPVGHALGAALTQALACAHFSQVGSWPVQVAVRGQGAEAMLLALVRIPSRAVTVQSLLQAVDHLSRWLDALPGRTIR